MTKKWPFGFFVYNDVDKKEEEQAAPETVEPAEVVKVVWSEPPAAVVAEEDATVAVEEAETVEEPEVMEAPETVEAVEEAPQEEVVQEEPSTPDEPEADFEDAENTDYSDMEEELEVALEEAHQKGLKKQRLFTGITAGVALLGAVGLATGLALRAHFKKK